MKPFVIWKQGFDDSETDSEVSLQTEVGSLKMIDPESMDDSSMSDHNCADSDGDLPCFSDTEALVDFTILLYVYTSI